MFAYCLNNPVNMFDSDGESAIAIGVILVSSAIVGTGMGAFSALNTGSNVAESALKGFGTGLAGAACGLFISSTSLAVATAAVAGTAVDLSVQVASQYISSGAIKSDELNWGSAIKTGVLTGVGAAIPKFPNAMDDIVESISTSIVWNEGATIVSVFDTVFSKVVDKLDRR